MTHFRRYIWMMLTGISISACNNQGDKKVTGADTAMALSDSAGKETDRLVYVDCYEGFFKDLPLLSDSDRVVLTARNGDTVKFKKFFREDLGSKYARYGLKSIDADTIPELIVYNYTGGAHCCDELYVFGKEKDSYAFRAKLYGGFICIDPVTNIITYSLNETLGYFFSCYACGFSDSTKGFQTIREIELAYKGGKFEVKPYAPATEKQVLHNLAVLKEHGFEEIVEGLMDSGWRKEFAMNFAVWHYNHGQNWNETKKLFDKYYTFKDAARIWKEFYSTLEDAKKENTF